MKQFIRPIRLYIVAVFILVALSYVAQALIPYFTQALLRREFLFAMIGYIGCTVFYLLCNYLSMRLEWRYGIVFSTSLKNTWFNQLLAMPQGKFSKQKVAEYVSYQANDLDALEKDYLAPLFSFYQQIMKMVIFAVIISQTVNIWVASILFITALLTIQVPKIIGKRTAARRDAYLKSQGDYYAKLEDLLTGHHLVNDETEENFQKVQQKSLDNLQTHYLKYGLLKAFGIIMNASSFSLTGIVLFIYLVFALSTRRLSIPEVAASLSYITAFSEPMTELLYDIQMLESIKNVKKNFLEIVSQVQLPKRAIKSFDKIEIQSLKKVVGNTQLDIPELMIKKGEKIAVIGENGSGKSTFLNVLNGTDDEFEGKIFVDGNEIKNLDGAFAKILQAEHTFHDTYKNNVTIFGSYQEKVSDTKSEVSATTLSGGEKQKMYLTRVTNQESPLVILDEPFSALDYYQFENELQKVLQLPATVIMTIHQKDEFLGKFNRILKLEKGKIVES
ncbi:ATP-binding cassette domain-containing protein [Lactococcus nasutitermitis]|uniref:ATP-binding cassette domain-containing protein n=1 Tax=Lactococcus nasutitermitis TaxID=1652957 RepID=A0ABV9JH12_9LACT|nr:ABC transporter ATP-binding protein [Lactococcus nasutitermitis]